MDVKSSSAWWCLFNIFFLRLLLMYVFESWNDKWEREKQNEVSHPLIHSPNAPGSWDRLVKCLDLLSGLPREYAGVPLRGLTPCTTRPTCCLMFPIPYSLYSWILSFFMAPKWTDWAGQAPVKIPVSCITVPGFNTSFCLLPSVSG